jgi:dTDP-4-dehydrorhamnose reductase
MQSAPLVVVTGASGQLGRELQRKAVLLPEFEFLFADRHVLDIRAHSQVLEVIAGARPVAVVNCAAYTRVDQAEDDPEEAMRVNGAGAGYVAEACHRAGALMVHVSTDYVFDGTARRPYTETDACAPLSVYGITKLEGERKIDEQTQRHFILRTSWLYSAFGHNFFRTMLRLAKETGSLRVVNDQVASPTYAGRLAEDIMALLRITLVDRRHLEYGTYHYTQSGEATWYDFAGEIMLQADTGVPVTPVPTESFPTKARRPAYSKLDTTKFVANTGLPVVPWQQGVAECLSHYISLT